MRVALITPWANAWVPLYKQAFEARGCEFAVINPKKAFFVEADVILHGWASGDSQPVLGARNVMFCRRYELFSGGVHKVDWPHVDHLICVNTWIAERVKNYFSANIPVSVIYNAVDPSKWTYRDRQPNNKIGMACHVHPKKNLPLALQILALLPEHYELHIAGEIQDPCTAEYLNHLAKILRRKVYLYGHIPREQLDLWWEQMGFCLSTSISEGNPNNVIEAMAKGIKPVVHDWPGARDQFSTAHVFKTAEMAVQIMTIEPYQSWWYLDAVMTKFSPTNIARVVDLCLQTEEAVA